MHQKGRNLGINLLRFITNSVCCPYFSPVARKDDSFLQARCLSSTAPNRPRGQRLFIPAERAGGHPAWDPSPPRRGSRGAQAWEAVSGAASLEPGAAPSAPAPSQPLRAPPLRSGSHRRCGTAGREMGGRSPVPALRCPSPTALPAGRCEDTLAPLQFRVSESLGTESTHGLWALTRAVPTTPGPPAVVPSSGPPGGTRRGPPHRRQPYLS